MSFLKNLMNSQNGGVSSDWKHLTKIEQLDDIVEISKEQPVVLFKHSTTCGISAAAKSRLEEVPFDVDKGVFYYLDLLSHRDVSNKIAEKFGVVHQSPQIIIIKDGVAVNNNSHHAINGSLVNEWVS
ncbi:MAG: bacillithiol system redox-active protein YtxJ [Saprospiraceae bacterium]